METSANAFCGNISNTSYVTSMVSLRKYDDEGYENDTKH